METILWILGVGALIGIAISLANKENPIAGAMMGGFMAGSCLIQILAPIIFLLFSFWLFLKIFG